MLFLEAKKWALVYYHIFPICMPDIHVNTNLDKNSTNQLVKCCVSEYYRKH